VGDRKYTPFIEIPDTIFGTNKNDSIYAGAFLDYTDGSFRYDRKFTNYGISGFMDINEFHSIGLFYYRSKDYINGSVFSETDRLQTRIFRIRNKTIDSSTVDILSDTVAFKAVIDSINSVNTIPFYKDLFDVSFEYTPMDMINLYDRFSLYKDHMLGLRYQFFNARPSYSIPTRVDNVFINALFFNSTYNIEYAFPGYDSIMQINEDKDIWINFDKDGNQMPFYSSIEESKDYFSLNVGWLERFPLPGNTRMSTKPPKGFTIRHFITANTFLGSFNRKLSDYAFNYPLKYRASYFLRAYPYAFDPIDTMTVNTKLPAYYSYDQFLIPHTDTLFYPHIEDAIDDDILDGNGIIYYGIEYTLELFQGVTIPGPGITVRGLYLSPFFEMANLWNRDWKNFNGWDLLPVTKEQKRNKSFLRDFGLRVDFEFMVLDSWHGLFSFTWARRLDLDDEILEIKDNGKIVYLDKDRFMFAFQLY